MALPKPFKVQIHPDPTGIMDHGATFKMLATLIRSDSNKSHCMAACLREKPTLLAACQYRSNTHPSGEAGLLLCFCCLSLQFRRE